jgi:predicted nucleotidyltransferase
MDLVSSSASSDTFRVTTPKADVTVDPRVVHDYRALNENMIKDNTPLPRQDAILERMVLAIIRRKLDLEEHQEKKGYPDSDDSRVKEVDIEDEIVEEYDAKWFKRRNKCKWKEAREQREEVNDDNFFWKGLCFW